jgi:dipeptidyl-peptidase-4
MRNMKIFFINLILSLLVFNSSTAQNKKLTYRQVFEYGDPKLLGSLPHMEGWLDDQHYLEYFSVPAKNISKLVKIHARTRKATTYLDYQALNDQYLQGFDLKYHVTRTQDHSAFILRKNNDLHYFSTITRQIKQLSNDDAPEKNPSFSPDGSLIAFTKHHNLFIADVEAGIEKQITYDGSDTIYNGWASWVYYEEILRRPSFYKAFWWAPNSRMIAFMRFDDSDVPEFPLTRLEDIHVALEIQRYPKAGEPIPEVKLAIYNIDTGNTLWIDMNGNSDHYIAWPIWSHDSKRLMLQWKNRDQNNLKIFRIDVQSGKTVEVYDERQPTWIEFIEDINFHILRDGSGFIIRSDRDDWYNLYYYDLDGQLKGQLTKGAWYVEDIAFIDEREELLYFHGALENKTEKHLYRVDLDGANLKKLTTIPGTHKVSISPGGSFFYDRYSNIHQPIKIDLFTTSGEQIRKIGNEKLALLDLYELGKAELFTIPSGDGFDLPASWVLPPGFDKSKKYPVIFYIYGGPDRREVSNEFQSFSHYFMAQNDIISISIDNRGSGHFGKRGMAFMHRNLGRWEIYDLIAAVKWLKQQPFIDSTKIGISGGSYGGYVSCMALTQGADYFTHGVARHLVSDWKLYDAVYTERYMDRPSENPQGYKFGSVMTHADKYRGKLLFIHGTLDDNVHIQNTMQLINLLQDLNKRFELMLYVNSRHGITYPKNLHAKREEIGFWFRHFLGKELLFDE